MQLSGICLPLGSAKQTLHNFITVQLNYLSVNTTLNYKLS